MSIFDTIKEQFSALGELPSVLKKKREAEEREKRVATLVKEREEPEEIKKIERELSALDKPIKERKDTRFLPDIQKGDDISRIENDFARISTQPFAKEPEKPEPIRAMTTADLPKGSPERIAEFERQAEEAEEEAERAAFRAKPVVAGARGIAEFAKETFQSINRNIASVGVTIAERLAKDPEEKEAFRKGVVDLTEVSPFLFGNKEVEESLLEAGTSPRPLEDRIATAELELKDWAKNQDTAIKKFTFNNPNLIATPVILGMAGLDLTPFGGLQKNAAKQAVKVTTREAAESFLKKSLKVADDISKRFADDVVKVADEDSAIKLINQIAETQSKRVSKEILIEAPHLRVEEKITPGTPLSRHFERIKPELNSAAEGIGFERISLEDQAKQAFDLVDRNPNEALKIAYGLSDPPTGLFRESVQTSLVESLKASGRKDLAEVIAKRTSLSLTDTAQKLNIAKLDLGSAGTRRIEGIVMDERLAKIGKKIPAGPEDIPPRTRALNKIKADAKKAREQVFDGLKKAEGLLSDIKLTQSARGALSDAIKKEGITVDNLYRMTSSERRNFFSRYVGAEQARTVNASFERAMVSNQKQAMSNWVWKNFYEGKSLYSEVQLEQAGKMFEKGLRAKDLKKMSPSDRITELSKYVGRENAEKLNTRFEKALRSDTLASWEERVIGSKDMFENQKLVSGLRRLNALDDLGVLNPSQTDNFLEDLVSLRLGVDVTPQEAKEISKLSRQVTGAVERVGDDWTYTNKDSVVDYFVNRNKLENYMKKLSPDTAMDVFTSIGARGSILFSVRSAMNSLMFQIIPGISRSVSKRIVTPFLIPGDYRTIDRMQVALSGLKEPFFNSKFWREQTKMSLEIYRKTGYDISRMQTLQDGFRYFGEKFTKPIGLTWGQSKGVAEKMGALVRGHAKLMEPGLKYAAGGTDSVFGATQRNGTTALLAKQVSRLEAKTGRLPEGLTRLQREEQLIREALSFNPKSVQGQYIREAGILDANHANFTANDFYGRQAIKFRKAIPEGIGKTIAPFAKIPANALGKGFEATGPGLIMGTKRILKATKMPQGVARNTELAESITQLVSTAGLLGTATFISSMLDEDDFIGPYDYTARNENGLTTTKNAGANYIRIGGNWVNLRWFGPLSLPISAQMNARRERARGKSGTIGYAKGIVSGILEFPVVKEFLGVAKSVEQAATGKTWNAFVEKAGLDLESIREWTQVRVIPSILSYDVQGLADETKYDSLGRPLPEKGFKNFIVGSNIKKDKSNMITDEFDKLNKTGNIPTLTEPTGEHVDYLEYMSKIIDERIYVDKLNKLKLDYADRIIDLISTKSYQGLNDEDKKKEIDKLRRERILTPLRNFSEAYKSQVPESWERFQIETSPSSVNDDRNPFQLLRDYVKGFITDPRNASRALFTKEKLGIVEGNLVELKRDYGEPFLNDDGSLNPRGSNFAKREMAREMGIPVEQMGEFRREHIVPVKAGGGNEDENLQLIPTELHKSYTPLDIAAGNAMKEGKMTRGEITEIMMAVKVDGTMTIDEAKEIIQERQ